MSRTLAIIKPDAVANGHTGSIVAHLEKAGFKIVGMKLMRLTRERAGQFYEIHRGRPFYEELVDFMSSGPCVPIALDAPNAVAKYRETIGATDPAEAAEGTVRKLYAESKGRNAVHGSDSDENAAHEIRFFFSDDELV